MIDVVRELREQERVQRQPSGEPTYLSDLAKRAADEIERLRKWNAEMVEKAASGGVLDGYRDLGARLAAKDAEIERLREALREAAAYPCTCDPAYYERGLTAPDCLADLVSDDAREALGEPPQCRGRAAARKTLE